ncbi:hypothetical protein L1987_30823 [Smallanthus sonchifolius]|uniref:Uncharacterized protein n=1 Tax=Smallanthus sonchifolius TaxID=185202 RepID=A0ACB9I4I6_9ASTR|nr:hypothetical protein L1987_30823 [Smallanthus sonchifolius]
MFGRIALHIDHYHFQNPSAVSWFFTPLFRHNNNTAATISNQRKNRKFSLASAKRHVYEHLEMHSQQTDQSSHRRRYFCYNNSCQSDPTDTQTSHTISHGFSSKTQPPLITS